MNVRHDDDSPEHTKRVKRGRHHAMSVEVVNPYAPIVAGMVITIGDNHKAFRVLRVEGDPHDEQHLFVQPI